MKAKDIKPGEVYAYRSSKSGSVSPIVFLAPVDSEHLYSTTSSHRGPDAPAFVKARRGAKPGRGSYYSAPTHGYPAITGMGDSSIDRLTSATLADFEAASSSRVDGDSYITYTVVTALGHIIGPYEETKAAVEAERQAEQDRRAAEAAARNAAKVRAGHLVEELSALGVDARPDDSWNPVGLVIAFDELDKLLALLADSSKEG